LSWTKWRLLAGGDIWYDDELDHNGPACYEHSIGGPRGGDRKIVYCGHTINERERMSSYGREGSHLAKVIRSHLNESWFLYYRARALQTKEQAEAMERRMLTRFDYDWNIALNS